MRQSKRELNDFTLLSTQMSDFKNSDFKKIKFNKNISDLGFVFLCMKWLKKNVIFDRTDKEFNIKHLFKRQAGEVISSQKATGCSDFALVTAAFLRSRNIPTKYIMLISQNWLKHKDVTNLEGHSILKFYFKETNDWYFIDPTKSFVSINIIYNGFIVAEGRDPWDIGIKNLADLGEKYVSFSV